MNEMDLRQGINMTIEKRRFGRTGHMSSAVLFGGAALGKSDQDEADQVLDLLFEFGINLRWKFSAEKLLGQILRLRHRLCSE